MSANPPVSENPPVSARPQAGDLPELTLPPEILAMMASFDPSSVAGPEAAGPAAGEPAAPETDAGDAGIAAPVAPPEDEVVLVLAPVLDITAAAPLHAALLAHRGAPLCVDGAQVKRLGGQCLQLLVSAGRTFAADTVPIRLQGASDALQRDLALFGIADPFLVDAA